MQLVNILCKLAQFYIPKKWQLSTERFGEIRYCHRVSVNTQKLLNFFTYIKECISYNYVYLILTRVNNSA